ncbi:caspase-like [Drosophila innubila]|uniref:caspase-like n=1 Tax=Drosophila innubila TaxID=198719 RepID=UPI00148DE968|nr:caspase-like [Drosophila innubila]
MNNIQFDATLMEDDATSTSTKALPKPPTDRNAPEYNMNHKNRGMAIIFNHKKFDKNSLPDRHGTDKDCTRLKNVLKKLDFDVAEHNDLCYKEIEGVIENAASKNHANNDCILIAIFSHGGEGHIYAKDTKYQLNNILKYFTANNCLTLAGKPKLFFVQACKGNKSQKSFMFMCQGSIDYDSYSIPDEADFLIAYSTIPGFVSFRNTIEGSWFIQSLCQELEENGRSYDLLTLLTFVNRRVANESKEEKEVVKQMPSIDSRLRHLVYFKEKSKSTATSQEKKT